jgi:serine/alanine adding enzyme
MSDPKADMTVRNIAAAEGRVWDTFVERNARATPFHQFRWKEIFERAYKLQAPFLGVFNGADLVGVLPVVVIRFPFRPPYAVSLPYCSYAGWLFEPGTDQERAKQEITSYLSAQGISFLELREFGEDFSSQVSEATLRLDLPASSDLLWKSLDPKVRNLVRKAERMGLTARWGVNQLHSFYEIYSRNMSDLGTPAHSEHFFRVLVNTLQDQVDILTVRSDERPIAAMFLLKFRSQLSDPWASSLRKFNSLSPNMLLYWEALRHGIDHGFKQFDFGRSHRDSGTYRFKCQWGAKAYPLKYSTTSAAGEMGTASIEMYRGSMGAAFSFFWRSLPYFLARRLGPRLRKYIP